MAALVWTLCANGSSRMIWGMEVVDLAKMMIQEFADGMISLLETL